MKESQFYFIVALLSIMISNQEESTFSQAVWNVAALGAFLFSALAVNRESKR